jgi:hypothetical protein
MGMHIDASRRWLPLAAIAIATAALLGAGCGGDDDPSAATKDATVAEAVPADAAAGGDDAATETMKLESQLSAAPKTKGDAPGSQMVFTGMLFKPDATSAIGRSQGSCTRTAPGAGAVFQCLLSFVLRDGVIFAQSVSSTGGPANGAITGGIGSYRDVRGAFTYKATGSPRVALTLRMKR